MFGRGLDDDRYVIERFQSMADGEIRPRRRSGSSKKGRGKTCREIVSLGAVQRMSVNRRPGLDRGSRRKNSLHQARLTLGEWILREFQRTLP